MRGEAVRQAAYVLLWASVGGVVLAFIFTAAFMSTYSPIDMGAFEAVFLGPLFAGFVVGALLANLDIEGVAYSAIVMGIIGLVLIYLVMLAPLLTGTAGSLTELPTTDQERQAIILSSVFLIPLGMMGAVLGAAFGEMALPSDEEVAHRRLVLQETREWHAMLRQTGQEGVPNEGPEEE